ncbi:hypothetical protein K8R04_04760 [Candidatus Uhrbacteria bacterium]|nr:hypothetical protein [Candidatus Uhrbacteria bacterium]
MIMSNHGHPKKRLPPPPPRPWKKAFFSYTETDESDDRKKKGDEVAKGLERIYLTDGKKDLGSFDHAKPHLIRRFFTWLVVLCALTSAIAWIGLVWLQPNTEIDDLGLEVKIEGPSAITLGEEQTFLVKYRNRAFQPISEAEVRLAWPADFQVTYTDPWPTETQNNAWKLGMLAPAAEGLITVRGIFLGSLGAKSAFQVIATYRPSGQTRSRESLATQSLDYGASVFDGGLVLPAKTVAGDQVPVIFELANRGDQELSGLLVRYAFPSGFLPSASTGTTLLPTADGKEWEQTLSKLAPGTTSTWRFSGAFASGSAGDASFNVRVGRLRGTEFLTLYSQEAVVPVLAGDLSLRVVANGSDTDRTLQPGDSLRIAVAYKNVSPEPLGGVVVTLGIESLINDASAAGKSLVDWNELEDSSHGTTSTKTRIQTIRYDKDSIPDFANLAPGEEGTIELSLPTLGVTSGTRDAVILLDLSGTLATVGKDKVNRVLHANPIRIRYRTDADIKSMARYFTEEGAPLGTGPLPPVAGKTTVYRIEWTVEKMLHSLENLEVTATLPSNVAWTGQSLADAGEITYEEATRTVRWKLNRMPEDIRELVTRFDVSLTPADLDIGRFARLLGETRFTATDSSTNEPLVRAKPAITTDLKDDESAEGKGVVKKP